MKTINLKLALIVLLAIIIGVVLGSVITKEKGEKLLPEEKEMIIKRTSFVAASREEISQFVAGLYDEKQNEFKLEKDSSPTLGATYYGVEIIKNLKISPGEKTIINPEAMLERVSSYYVSPGYYLEEGKDPVFSTVEALALDVRYQEDLNQEIDLVWLESNSLGNENLESAKFDPQYQRAVLEIYRYLGDNQREIRTRIMPSYVDYYCNYSPNETSDGEYLRKKNYQRAIIFYFTTGLKNVNDSCLRKEDIELDKDRLSKINFKDLNDIKEVFWLYHLQNFYNLRPDLRMVFGELEKFYSEGGFKEKLSDKEPTLIGTFYGVLLNK